MEEIELTHSLEHIFAGDYIKLTLIDHCLIPFKLKSTPRNESLSTPIKWQAQNNLDSKIPRTVRRNLFKTWYWQAIHKHIITYCKTFRKWYNNLQWSRKTYIYYNNKARLNILLRGCACKNMYLFFQDTLIKKNFSL